jgi:hypothetical protein
MRPAIFGKEVIVDYKAGSYVNVGVPANCEQCCRFHLNT